ncbi:MAG: hypothetical protein JWN66_1495 [Sphingomonas bacterium]|uniref:CcdC protein domain-containing protein n=1 Tax=Sphingomonas bacterium TaxID=1895847 RepID=UPI002627C0E5|nr:CcdC protein domain-containing protein [Sphingomonas bacterium]MDB5704379.1 hypothetical protein [Sphingomonas bacterium]
MQVHTAQPQGWLQYAVPLAIFIVIFGFRARRLAQLRPLKIERLWIFPAIYLVICTAMLVQFPPTLAGWGLCAIALAVGAGLGWQRGKLMAITVDPETHQINQKASFAGIAFLFVIVAIRAAARVEGSALHLNIALLTDMLVVLALGLFSVQRLEMYLRAKRLLEEARAARA